ncbi:MAG: 4Fe-4S dicluster domain-containing protein [bacterium]|nr:4Fe-4S dicluster domain-containing protein [bacterium]
MKTLKVPNTYDISLSGAPSLTVSEFLSVSQVAVLPSTISHLKPKLTVKIGDSVARGQAVAFDKLSPEVKLVSPVSGTVKDIVYGQKRRLDAILISCSGDAVETHSSYTKDTLNSLDAATLKQLLLKSGLWPSFVALPFMGLAPAEGDVPAIYVAVNDDEPFAPHASVVLKGKQDQFRFGLAALKKLSKSVVVSAAMGNEIAGTALSDVVDVLVEGKYPANQPATVAYNAKPDATHNKAWTIKCQDVIAIGEFLSTGVFPNTRVIALAGPKVKEPQHMRVTVGSPIKDVVAGRCDDSVALRYIAGGVLTGRNAGLDSYLGFNENAINVLQDEFDSEFMNFVGLGPKKATYSRAYLGAAMGAKKWDYHTGVNGSARDCVACGYCAEVCSVGILPQFLMRNVVAGDVDESLAHGLLDCSECGLCTFVCPSKIELTDMFVSQKTALLEETR